MKVIEYKNLPARLPLFQSLVVWLMLDRFDASGVVQGILWTLMAVIWLSEIVKIHLQEEVNVV